MAAISPSSSLGVPGTVGRFSRDRVTATYAYLSLLSQQARGNRRAHERENRIVPGQGNAQQAPLCLIAANDLQRSEIVASRNVAHARAMRRTDPELTLDACVANAERAGDHEGHDRQPDKHEH